MSLPCRLPSAHRFAAVITEHEDRFQVAAGNLDENREGLARDRNRKTPGRVRRVAGIQFAGVLLDTSLRSQEGLVLDGNRGPVGDGAVPATTPWRVEFQAASG